MLRDSRSVFQKGIALILQQGEIPEHIGLIMDGNRRYAKGLGIPRVEGHRLGFNPTRMANLLQSIFDTGVKEVTLYALSIDNLKRSKEELDDLNQIYKDLIQSPDLTQMYQEGLCFQLVGEWDKIPNMLKPVMAKLMVETRHNTKSKLNFAFAYGSHNEVSKSVDFIQNGLREEDISEEDICPQLILDLMHLVPSTPVGLLIRTSGETRLSDFLLLEASHSILSFEAALWPQFNYSHVLKAIFSYQINRRKVSEKGNSGKQQLNDVYDSTKHRAERVHKFIEKIRETRWKLLQTEC